MMGFSYSISTLFKEIIILSIDEQVHQCGYYFVRHYRFVVVKCIFIVIWRVLLWEFWFFTILKRQLERGLSFGHQRIEIFMADPLNGMINWFCCIKMPKFSHTNYEESSISNFMNMSFCLQYSVFVCVEMKTKVWTYSPLENMQSILPARWGPWVLQHCGGVRDMSQSTGRSMLKVRVCKDHPDNSYLNPGCSNNRKCKRCRGISLDLVMETRALICLLFQPFLTILAP